MKKCLYCNKVIENEKIYCNNNCEDKYNNFKNFADKWKKLFCILISVYILTTWIGSILTAIKPAVGKNVLSLGIMSLGLTIAIFPFATPQTFKKLGVKKTLLIVRGMGVGVCILGLIYFFS